MTLNWERKKKLNQRKMSLLIEIDEKCIHGLEKHVSLKYP